MELFPDHARRVRDAFVPLEADEKRELARLCRKLDREPLPRITRHAAPLRAGRLRPELPRARGTRPRALARAGRLRRDAPPARGRAPVRLLRGSADRQRRARRRTTCCRACSRTSFPRYKTMRGYQCRARRAGTATACRSSSRSSASSASAPSTRSRSTAIAEFNQRCRESVFSYVEEWDRLTERIGFWIDLDDAYVTLAQRVHRVGLVGAARRSGTRACSTRATRSCPTARAAAPRSRATRWRSATRTSSTRRSTCASGQRAGGPLQAGDSLLVWTTTPWTLVSNAAVAVDPELTYVRAQARRRSAASSPRRWSSAVLGEERARCSSASPAASSSARATSRRSPTSRRRVGERGHTVLAGRLRDDRGRHRARAHRARVRRGRLPPRRAATACTVVNPVLADGTYDERVGRFAGRFVKEADADHRSRTCASRGRLFRAEELRAHLSALLALRHAAALLREGELVHPHHRDARRAARRQRGDQLAPGAHQARPLRQLAREQRRLGALARALLGHAAAVWRCERGPRTAASARCEELRELAGARARRPAHALTSTRSSFACADCGGRDAARARGDRRLVRLGLDAVRAVPLPVRERGRCSSSASRPTSSARRSTRRAAGSTRCSRSRRCCSAQLELQERALPRPDPRPRGPEDVQEPRQRRRALGRDRRATAPTRFAGTTSPRSSPGRATASRSRRSARACASSCSRSGTPTASTCSTRTSTASTTPRTRMPAAQRPELDRWILSRLQRHDRDRARGARRLRHDLGRPRRSPRSSTISRTGTCAAAAAASGARATASRVATSCPPT